MTKVGTQTITRVRTQIGEAFEQAGLTREEELVLRLRHGISAPAATTLSFRGEGQPELQAKLAFIEASAIDALRAGEAEADQDEDAIIDRLKSI